MKYNRDLEGSYLFLLKFGSIEKTSSLEDSYGTTLSSTTTTDDYEGTYLIVIIRTPVFARKDQLVVACS